MEVWHDVGAADELADGEMRSVQAGEHTVLLVRLDGRYHALQERCPHLRAHLARGTLSDGVITCPAHGSRFEVASGRNLAWVEGLPGIVRRAARAVTAPRDLAVYRVEVVAGRVRVAQ